MQKPLTTYGQRIDANSKTRFTLHPVNQCPESNMPQMLLLSLSFSSAFGNDGVTGLYCKPNSLWTGSITLALKTHLTPHCLTARHGLLKFPCPSWAVSVANSQRGHSGALPLHFLSWDRWGQTLGKEFPDNSTSYCTATAPDTITCSWTDSMGWWLLFPCVYVFVVLCVCMHGEEGYS